MRKRPSLSVVADCARIKFALVTVTIAAVTTAWLLSVTTPSMVPVVEVCADAGITGNDTHIVNAMVSRSIRVPIGSGFLFKR